MLSYLLSPQGSIGDYSWVKISGSLRQVSVGLQDETHMATPYKWNVWGVNSQNEIWRWPEATSDLYPGNLWGRILGTLVQVSVGPTALPNQPSPTVWGVNQSYEIWRWRGGFGTGNYWDKIAGNLKRISVGGAGVWGVNSSGDVYRWSGGGGTGNSWDLIASLYGPLADIAVGDTHVWGLTTAGEIIRRPAAGAGNLSTWVLIQGSLVQIAASETDVCGVNGQGEVLSWRGSNISQANTWLKLVDYQSASPQFRQVSVGVLPAYHRDRGTIWAVDVADDIWRWMPKGTL